MKCHCQWTSSSKNVSGHAPSWDMGQKVILPRKWELCPRTSTEHPCIASLCESSNRQLLFLLCQSNCERGNSEKEHAWSRIKKQLQETVPAMSSWLTLWPMTSQSFSKMLFLFTSEHHESPVMVRLSPGWVQTGSLNKMGRNSCIVREKPKASLCGTQDTRLEFWRHYHGPVRWHFWHVLNSLQINASWV